MSESCDKYWFTNLKEDEKIYIKNHPDPSHMIVYLKKGLNFNESIRQGYSDAMKEERELESNTLTAINNKKINTNLLL